jgi:hypothetical protein
MKQCILRTLLLLGLFLTSYSICAQPSEPGYPAALHYRLPTNYLPIVNLPYLNNEELKAADTPMAPHPYLYPNTPILTLIIFCDFP